MRTIIKLLFFCLVLAGSAQAQEQLEVLTYFPAPIGVYKDVRTNIFRDNTAPTNYFLDLDGRSKIFRLNISVPSDQTAEMSLLQVGGTLAADSSDRATAYFRNVGYDRIGICGETENIGTEGSSYAVYGYAHSTNKINIGVYGLAEGNIDDNDADYGVVGSGPDWGLETGVLGKGNTCGVLVNTGKTSGIDSNEIKNSGVEGYSTTQHGLHSYIFNVGSSYHAGYFVGENGAPGLYAYGDGDYGIYAESDYNYAGHFKANRTALYVKNTLEGNTGAPEIVGADNHFVLTMTVPDSEDEGYVRVRAPNGDDAYFGAAIYNPLLLPSSLNSISLVSKASYTSRAFIISTHPIELNPGQDVLSDRYINFNGNVYVGSTGFHVSDLAEPFELIEEDSLELGDVVVIDYSGKGLRKSDKPYDTNIAGVISSKEQAAVVIGYRKDKTQDKPLALAGKVMCKVDTNYSGIEPGDLLTTSPTPGHAMKAVPILEEDGRYIYPTGTILGIALEGLDEGRKGKILVLVGLE